MTGADARRIREALVDPTHVARLLGIETRARAGRRSIDVRCFAHDDREASLSLFVGGDRTLGFRCHAPQCNIGGDVLSLIKLRNAANDFREVLEIGERLVGGAGLPPMPRRYPDIRPPSPGSLRRVLAKCSSTAQDEEVSAWLRSRALDAAAIDAAGAAHALAPTGGGLPRYARFWAGSGYRLIMSAYSAPGVVSTVRARRIVGGTGRRKVLAPEGGSTAGAVLANQGGIALLRGDAGAPSTVVVVEGESDLLSLPCSVAGLGLVARDSWTPEIGHRCWGREVVLATDDDAGGDAHALDVLPTISGRCLVRDINATTRERRAAGQALASAGDLNDLLVAGGNLLGLFERARVVSDPDTVAVVAQELAKDEADEAEVPVAPRETPEAVLRAQGRAMEALRRVPLRERDRAVMTYLIQRAWWHPFPSPEGLIAGESFPAVDTIAARTGMSHVTVRASTKELERRGLLTLTKRRSDGGKHANRTHLYRLCAELVNAGTGGVQNGHT